MLQVWLPQLRCAHALGPPRSPEGAKLKAGSTMVQCSRMGAFVSLQVVPRGSTAWRDDIPQWTRLSNAAASIDSGSPSDQWSRHPLWSGKVNDRKDNFSFRVHRHCESAFSRSNCSAQAVSVALQPRTDPAGCSSHINHIWCMVHPGSFRHVGPIATTKTTRRGSSASVGAVVRETEHSG